MTNIIRTAPERPLSLSSSHYQTQKKVIKRECENNTIMPNEGLMVPTYPRPVANLSTSRRSSLSDTMMQQTTGNNHLVVPLMSSLKIIDASNQHHGSDSISSSCNGIRPGLNKIDAVAISLAAKAKRQQQHEQESIIRSPSPPKQEQNQPLSQIYTNRRGSLDANVEYAVAMVNIVNPIYDMDDRDMCPFGTRRDSVCGGGGGGNNNRMNNTNESPTRIRRRILKSNHQNTVNDPNKNVASKDTELEEQSDVHVSIPSTTNAIIHQKIATISLTTDTSLVNHNHHNGNRPPLPLTERVSFY